MDHKYMRKIAKLYNSEDVDSEEMRQIIQKNEVEAVTRYITDISNGAGIRNNMEDLPIVIAAMRAQSDFLEKNLDEGMKKYVEHLENLAKKVRVCTIEVDLAELMKQINKLKDDRDNNKGTDSTSDGDKKDE